MARHTMVLAMAACLLALGLGGCLWYPYAGHYYPYPGYYDWDWDGGYYYYDGGFPHERFERHEGGEPRGREGRPRQEGGGERREERREEREERNIVR